jgi:hypothetical protein
MIVWLSQLYFTKWVFRKFSVHNLLPSRLFFVQNEFVDAFMYTYIGLRDIDLLSLLWRIMYS